MNRIISLSALLAMTACSLAPDFHVPEMKLPVSFGEETNQVSLPEAGEGAWKPAEALEKADRGKWWTMFGDGSLDQLEQQAMEANPTLKAAAARVDQSRAIAGANVPSILPNIDLGGNAVRAKTSGASLVAFGAPAGAQPKPYTLFSAQGVASYEADLFGRVRDNYKAYEADAGAAEAAYKSALLALQADVAGHYLNIRALDAERQLLRDTVAIRAEAARIMKRRFDLGDVGELDHMRAQSDLSSARADLSMLDQQRAMMQHALAVLLGKMPSDFTLTEASFDGVPPEIPAGLPSRLLERRPDIAQAQAAMAAANARIGVARTAFFPTLMLTASGGFESSELADLFKWSSRSWALGQMAGTALGMTIFDSGRNLSRLDQAHAAYDESVANYQSQVLVAFRDVEDSLVAQRMLADQSRERDLAAQAASRATNLSRKRYDEGESDYFEVVDSQRTSLAAERGAIQTRGQRMLAAISLVRALGGSWQELTPSEPVAESHRAE